MKKKRIIAASVALTLMTGIGIASAADVKGITSELIKYTNNGKTVTPSSPAVNINGHLYLPIRSFSEAIGK